VPLYKLVLFEWSKQFRKFKIVNRDVKSRDFLLPESDNQDIQMTSFGFSTIKPIERWGDVVNEKLRVRMVIFTKISNKIHITTQNNNLSIGMNAYM
jgi:hypothetical protein